MHRPQVVTALMSAGFLCASLFAQQSNYPQVQPFPPGSTFGSSYPQVQNQNQYPQQQQQPQYAQPQQPQYSQQQQPQYSQQQPAPQDQQQYQQQSQQDYATDQQHAAARVSVIQGQVNVRRGDNGDLVAATANNPVMTQDHLQTGADGRAEIELDNGNVVRLAANTDLGFADLEYHKYQLTLGVGTVMYGVLRDDGSQAEIDTPALAVRPARVGQYRISVYDDGSAQVTVRSGALEIVTPSGSRWLSPGQSILARGNASAPDIQDVAAPTTDDLDSWGLQRDQQILNSPSYKYVSPEIAGAEDLDNNGTWVPSQYGEVWAPRAPVADWAPYSYGSWSYEPYWGWTWVDSASWGWAPYHYGRWFYNGGYGWCWWPGAYSAGVWAWSPAVVGFYGYGSGLGWVALAPYEPPCRWWGAGFGFGLNIGFGFGFHAGFGWGGYSNPWGCWHNLGYPHGAIWASYNNFSSHTYNRYTYISKTEIHNTTFIQNNRFPVQPSRQSYAFTNRQAVMNSRLNVAANRNFVAANRAVYHSQNFRMQAPQAAQHGFAQGYAQNRPQNTNNGWHGFGQPGNAAQRQGAYNAQDHNTGWHSFGQPEHGVPPGRNPAPVNSFAGPQPGVQHGVPPNMRNNNQYNAPVNNGLNRNNANPYSAPRSFERPAQTQQQYRAPQNFSAPRQQNLPQTHYATPAPQRSMTARPYSAPSYNAPRYTAPSYNRAPSYSAPHYSAPSYSAPHYAAPSYSAPHYSAPAQHYSAPAPHYSAPSAPHFSGGGGGGGGHVSGGGGGHVSGGGGGHHR